MLSDYSMYRDKSSNGVKAYRDHGLFTLEDSLHAMQKTGRSERVVVIPDDFYTACNFVNDCHNGRRSWVILEALDLMCLVIFASQV